jgi:PilZ domain
VQSRDSLLRYLCPLRIAPVLQGVAFLRRPVLAGSLLDLGKPPVNELGETRQKRRHERIEMEVEVIVRTDSALLPGRTYDISESGMSAILPVELREGQEVELQIRLPRAAETTRAIVRNRNVYRHGFEFVQPLHGIFEAVTGA